MTMLAACRFRDGAVMIADTRATWLGGNVPLFQDSLEKIVPLGRRTAIGFAGDVQSAELVIRKLRGRMQKRPRLQFLGKLAAEVPRIAKHYYALHRSRTGTYGPLELILGGVTASGSVEIWWFQSPNFQSSKLAKGFVVRGTGAVVESYIQNNLERFDRDLPTLKARADALVAGLEAELGRKGIDTVGGLLQVILLGPDGIRPMSYGFINLDPEGPAHAKRIDMEAGRWVQHDIAAGLEVPLAEPSRLLSSGPADVRVQDFHLPSGEPTTPKWHLTYFLTCLAIQKEVGTIEFRGVVSNMASPRYPFLVKVLAAVGLWGSLGDHEIEFSLIRDGDRQQVRKEVIHIEYLPEEIDLAFHVPLRISSPGPAFLECRIAGQLLGQRALYFGQISESPPSREAEFAEFVRRQSEAAIEQHRACSDPALDDSGESTLVYLSLCQNCTHQDTLLRFERQMMAVFWKSYPLKLRVYIASAFRMSKGKHQVRVELVDAASRKVSPITTATVESTSSCIVVPIHGELGAFVPGPGIYFVNVYIDDRLTGTALLAAETDRPQYSYNLDAADAGKVSDGELLILLKRAQQRPNGE